jgi:glucose-6-phosphate isomerase
MIEVRYKNSELVDQNSQLFKKLFDAHQRLVKKDFTIWGPDASEEAKIRMDWIDLPTDSRELLAQLDALTAKFRHLSTIVLCGMGGSSLGPEVIAQTYGKKLIVLDSTDPHYVSHCLPEKLETTLVIVGSKSGSTIETASQKSLFESRFEAAGLDKTKHMIIVTDPDSPLDIASRKSGFTVVNANPNIGGRFSVLGAFGLVPSAFLGIDVSIILDSAAETKESLIRDPYPALRAAYAIISATVQYFAVTDEHSKMPGLSDWIEQLVAESTGKNGVGRLPIVINSAQDSLPPKTLTISFVSDADLVISGDLGSQFFFWEWVTALLGSGLSIDPFNQPNVQESKLASGALLTTWGNSVPALNNVGTDNSIAFFCEAENAKTLLADFLNEIQEKGYLAIMAYMDREKDSELIELRNILARKTLKAVTFGWGPRFLHSTGQYHKGAQANGSFLQITAESDKDFDIPGKDFTFKSLINAQANGDKSAIASRGLPIMRLHLLDRAQGISQLLAIARSL